MCVQFMIKRSLKELSVLYGAEMGASQEEYPERVFPKYSAPVLGFRDGLRVLKVFRYGFIPSFEKSEKPKMVFHNARFESVADKPSFRNAFLKQRCLVPLDAFYEYVYEGEERRGLGRFSCPEGQMLTAAGIFHHWKSPSGEVIPTFAILTREASPFLLKSGHDRSPFFLSPGGMDSWLNPKLVESEVLKRTLLEGALVPELALEMDR